MLRQRRRPAQSGRAELAQQQLGPQDGDQRRQRQQAEQVLDAET
jgi:hypothetical protein